MLWWWIDVQECESPAGRLPTPPELRGLILPDSLSRSLAPSLTAQPSPERYGKRYEERFCTGKFCLHQLPIRDVVIAPEDVEVGGYKLSHHLQC